MSEQVTRGWQRPSIYDVAKHAGVSHMTVSRVLNGHPNIRESTRERVLQAIDAVEAIGVDTDKAAPDHWRHVHNRLRVGQEPRAYTRARHRAWLLRRRAQP